jgi:hypothetical protein
MMSNDTCCQCGFPGSDLQLIGCGCFLHAVSVLVRAAWDLHVSATFEIFNIENIEAICLSNYYYLERVVSKKHKPMSHHFVCSIYLYTLSNYRDVHHFRWL